MKVRKKIVVRVNTHLSSANTCDVVAQAMRELFGDTGEAHVIVTVEEDK